MRQRTIISLSPSSAGKYIRREEAENLILAISRKDCNYRSYCRQ